MDPQMVWDAMDECEMEEAKTQKPKKQKSSKEPEEEETTAKPVSRPRAGMFGFPFAR